MAQGGFTAVVLDQQWARKVILFEGSRIIGSRVYLDPTNGDTRARVRDYSLVENTVETVLNRAIARQWKHPNDDNVWSLHLTVGVR